MKNKKWLSKSRLYYVWRGMKDRCYYRKDRNYKNYGGRGIKVCKEWINNFECFKEWAYKNGYNENAKRGECTLDRINVEKDYEPNNCRFISNKQQCNNKRNNIIIEYEGQKHTLKEWSEIVKINYSVLLYRKYKNWDIQKMLTLKPKIGRNQYEKQIS